MSKVRTVDLDRVVASAPSNRTAAIVTGRGVHWEPKFDPLKCPGKVHSDTPPRSQPLPRNAASLIGLKVGRFTVTGYGGRGSSGARWIVRCACGSYEHRSAKFLKADKAKAEGMCDDCGYLEELKAGRKPARG